MIHRFGAKKVAGMIAEGQNRYLYRQRYPKVIYKLLFVDHMPEMKESKNRQSSSHRLFSLIALRCRSALKATSAITPDKSYISLNKSILNRQKLNFGSGPIKYGTRATAVELDDWSFSIWPVGALYWIKDILSLVSNIAEAGVNLFLTAASIFGHSIYVVWRLRNKS